HASQSIRLSIASYAGRPTIQCPCATDPTTSCDRRQARQGEDPPAFSAENRISKQHDRNEYRPSRPVSDSQSASSEVEVGRLILRAEESTPGNLCRRRAIPDRCLL